MVEESSLLGWALHDHFHESKAKLAQLEVTLASQNQELVQLHQAQEAIARQAQEFTESTSSWEFKYNFIRIELESRVNQLDDQIKAQEEQHLVNLERV